MALAEDDPFAPPKKKLAHEIGEPLDTISADELRERIGLLEAEIARLRTAADAKEASKRAADAFFKSSS
jgi:uncharacterized small protein (DUF1192 family)